MRAVEVAELGGPEVLVAREAPDPVAGPGQAVVRVSVAHVLFVETQIRSGWGREYFTVEPPYVPGDGVAGQVMSVGDGVEPGWVGRSVVTCFLGKPGGRRTGLRRPRRARPRSGKLHVRLERRGGADYARRSRRRRSVRSHDRPAEGGSRCSRSARYGARSRRRPGLRTRGARGGRPEIGERPGGPTSGGDRGRLGGLGLAARPTTGLRDRQASGDGGDQGFRRTGPRDDRRRESGRG